MEGIGRRQWMKGAAAFGAVTAVGAEGALRLRAFDAEGKPAPGGRLGTLLLIDRDGRPFELLPKVGSDGTATIGVPGAKFEIIMILPVRGFGRVYLYADNGGELYTGGGERLLNYEFARSRAAFVGRYIDAHRKAGVEFSAETTGRLERGRKALADAEAAKDPSERARRSNDSLAETMWAGETAALERARHRIAKRGARQGFLFGCNAFEYAKSDEYAKKFAALLNFGTLPFYRAGTEKTEGAPDYSEVDAILEKMAGTQLMVKGHPLIWFHQAGTPEFLKQKSYAELKRSCRGYVLRSVGRYRTRIHAWDIINEAHDWANDLHLNAEQLVELTRLGATTVREADPTAFRLVNNCCTWGEYAARRRTYSGPLGRRSRTPLEYLKAVNDAKVPYEAIGLQVYYPQRDMLEIERQMERFLRLGKPVHITELGVSSANEPMPEGEVKNPDRNVWHGTEWSETIKADWPSSSIRSATASRRSKRSRGGISPTRRLFRTAAWCTRTSVRRKRTSG